MPQSESSIENATCNYATAEGLSQYKFVSPNNRGVPDRIFLYRGVALFIEFKAEGVNSWGPLQIYHRDKLRAQGCTVELVNSVVGGKAAVDEFVGNTDALLNHWGG